MKLYDLHDGSLIVIDDCVVEPYFRAVEILVNLRGVELEKS